MRFTNKFKSTSLIALALVLGACSGGEFSSSTSNSISSSSSNGNSSSISSSTSSSSVNYIPITNAQELSNIRNNLSGNYRLMNDIDLESVEWQPIGSGSTPFSGTLDGNEFIITNLKITQSQEYVGLFAYNYGTIRNLKMENVEINVTGSFSSLIHAGALAGESSGTFENIEIKSGSLHAKARGGNQGFVGGVVGVKHSNDNEITLDKIVNNINVSGENTRGAGGIIGFTIATMAITDSMNTGSVSGTENVGGIIGCGLSETITITNSMNSGSITGTENVGGIIGNTNADIITTNLINNGNVSGTENVGGLFGWRFSSGDNTISGSMNNGSISGTENIGGLIGFGGSHIISDSINSGNVSGDYFIGGLVGNGVNNIVKSMNSGNVSGNSSVGGLTGYARGFTPITNSINIGSVSGTSNQVGGLIGYGFSTTITNSTNSGTISGSEEVGGLIGQGTTTYIINSMNSGSTIGNYIVGGLIGSEQNFSAIANSINIGSISGSSAVGGLVGQALSQLFVNDSVNFGNVVATSTTPEVGGIAGRIPASSDFEEVYHYGSITSNGVEVPGTNFGTKVTDISTFNLAFFTTTLGWDTEIWDFTGLDIANGVYPKLKNMPVVEE